MHSLYIHIPFCDKKCFYCSFVVTVGQLKRADQYIDALKKEALGYRGVEIKSIYLGGGTPTTLNIHQINDLMRFIKNNFKINHHVEFTIEANPEGLDLEKLIALRDLGVNRISLGIQTFRDDYLKYLGRIHSREKAIESFHLIRRAGFKNVSCDLMISFPDQTKEQLMEDLDNMISLNSEHISLYSLTIEPNSRFYTKNVQPLDADTQAEHFQIVLEYTKKHGYGQYEVSNFAKKGYESLHNMNYWECGDYLGLGVSAHSHIQGKRFQNVDRFSDYLKMAEENNLQPVSTETLSSQERLKEALLFGLRMAKGIDLPKLEEKYGCVLESHRKDMIDHFIQEGLLVFQNGHLKTTHRGMMVLDELCTRLY
ncbi:MAG: radical SAM family heme chaperone HemW [Candidatus Omnitrophica bacterium]|nr:radical SAM family heme chaperone HemW [Candidatus Omnitrophota bacterium]